MVKNVYVFFHTTLEETALMLFWAYIELIRDCKAVIIFPDSRAYMVLICIGLIFGKKFKTPIFYNVIGGWLAKYLRNSPRNIKYIKKLRRLFVQTPTILNDLKAIGVSNTVLFPNFRYRNLLIEEISNPNIQKPLKLVSMARVTKEKGIDLLIRGVDSINSNGIKYSLDIYGQIEDRFRQEFMTLINKDASNVRYCGIIEENNVGNVMKDYFLHVFPTRLFHTEGYPGSILDAFYAGVPTLAAKWNSFNDVIKDGINGIGFKMEDSEDLKAKLLRIYEDPTIVTKLKVSCITEGQKFKPNEIIRIMTQEIDNVLNV